MKEYEIEKAANYSFYIEKDYSSFEIRTLKNYIKKLINYILLYYRDNKPSNVSKALLDELKAFNNKYCSVANMRGNYLELNAIKRIIDKKEIFLQEIKKIRSNEITSEEQNAFYTDNFAENDITVVRKLILSIIENDKKKKNAAGTRQSPTIYCSDLPDERFAVEIIKSTKRILPKLEKNAKEKLKEYLKFIFDFLDKFDLAETYVKQQDIKMRQMCLGELSVKLLLEGKIKPGEKITFKDIFTDEMLDGMDLNDLMMLTTAYQNRLAKEIREIGEALLAINSTGLTQDIFENQDDAVELENAISKKCTDYNLNIIKNKSAWINNMVLRMHRSKNNDEMTDDEVKQGYSVISFEEEIKKITDMVKDRYEAHYNKKSQELINSFESDFITGKLIRDVEENIYAIKDHLLGITVCELLKNQNKSASRNFGVILEKTEKRKSNKVLIGIDIEGLSMPIKVHSLKRDLIERLNQNQGNSIVPEYQGAEDFWGGGNLLSTSILLPMNKAYEKKIKELQEKFKGKSEEKLLAHLRFLANNSKFPKHLMEKVTDKKGKVTYRRIPKRYIDISTGDEYSLNPKKGYEPIDLEDIDF